MILGGTNIRSQTENNSELSSAVLSLTHLVLFNAVKRSRPESQAVRHNMDREILLPLYIGILAHKKTRKRDFFDVLFKKGLSISYDRIFQLSIDAANKVIDLYEQDEVVCSTTFRGGLYTIGNLDNIDHNPTSTSAQDTFHGPAMSLIQHLSNENTGVIRHKDYDVS